jgi:hypothetical protein
MVYSAPWQHFSTQCAISLAVYGPKTRFCIWLYPDSPDLALSDFSLFPKLKYSLKNIYF